MLQALTQIVGEEHVLTGEAAEPYLVDWRGRYRGKAQAVVRPASTEEVAAVIRHCVDSGVPVVTVGGNTGLCGGATPDDSGQAVVLSTARLNRVRAIDTDNDTLPLKRVVFCRPFKKWRAMPVVCFR